MAPRREMSRKHAPMEPRADAVSHRRTGIEQELVVRRGIEVVDFAAFARTHALPGIRVDPDDPHAHRQATGGVITVDGAEAEIATEPQPLGPNFTVGLSTSLQCLRSGLDAVLTDAGEMSAQGVSTHLNVEIKDSIVVDAARRFAARHSAAMMLLLDRVTSPGLLVRPRRGRLELGGEYAVGKQLTAATVFAAAAALDCERSRHVKLRSQPTLQQARARFGWYVDRNSFGPDLYRDGRSARLGRLTGQDLLDWSWSRSRPQVERLVAEHELRAVDDVVAGRHPLPCEQPDVEKDNSAATKIQATNLTVERVLGPVTVRPVLASWDHVAFAVTGGSGVRYVAMPEASVVEWLSAFESGQLTGWCLHLLNQPAARLPVLVNADDVGAGRAFGAIANGVTLSPQERQPFTGRLSSGPPGGARRHKHDEHSSRESVPSARSTPSRWGWWAAVASAAAVVALIAGAFALFHRGSSGDRAGGAPNTPLPTATISTATPAVAPRAHEQLARSLAGVYDVREVVTQGNGSLQAGKVFTSVLRLRLHCSADSCTVATSGTPARLKSGSLRFEGRPSEPCPDKSGGVAKDHYILHLRPVGRSGSTSRLVGGQFLESVDVSQCRNVAQKPVRLAWTATRR